MFCEPFCASLYRVEQKKETLLEQIRLKLLRFGRLALQGLVSLPGSDKTGNLNNSHFICTSLNFLCDAHRHHTVWNNQPVIIILDFTVISVMLNFTVNLLFKVLQALSRSPRWTISHAGWERELWAKSRLFSLAGQICLSLVASEEWTESRLC